MRLFLFCLLVLSANAQKPATTEEHSNQQPSEQKPAPTVELLNQEPTTQKEPVPIEDNSTQEPPAEKEPASTEEQSNQELPTQKEPAPTAELSNQEPNTQDEPAPAEEQNIRELPRQITGWAREEIQQDWAEEGSECKIKTLPFPWTWRCEEGACVRRPADKVTDGATLAGCKLTCGEAKTLWPKPTGSVTIGKKLVSFQYSQVAVIVNAPQAVRSLVEKAGNRFKETLRDMRPPGGSCLTFTFRSNLQVAERQFTIRIGVESSETSLTLDTSEFYKLNITHTDDDNLEATIEAKTFFGARHGLETLSQLVGYDDINDALETVTATISDEPVYPIRGLTLDTSRNFISVAGLRRTIDGMAMNKLNTLHWHITDTHSFPIEINSEPRLAQYGAYSPRRVYTNKEVVELVEYAQERGVRLLPEFDMPAHVGYGWQWGPEAGLGNLTVCLGKEPWQSYCVEPPCGQMNIINENLYPVLKKILVQYHDVFKPDIFHIGGDEINLNCWKTTPEIAEYVRQKGGDPTDDEEYMKLWIQFQDRVYDMWTSIAGAEKKTILWTSHLTQRPAEESGLDPSKYIIQVWTTGKDKQIGDLLRQGYQLILSNYDAWYLDCGVSAWVGKGNNWCSPYKSWQTVYDNSPRQIARSFQQEAPVATTRRPSQTARQSDLSQQMLGGSAALWTEQADDSTLDNKLWPRGAALAERLWAEPETDSLVAEKRLLHHRRRMVARGIQAETMQPEYCYHYEGSCYVDASKWAV